ncbi:MAG: extracellular solute-binding protein, partial [Anaerolineales bacterium]
MKFRLLLWLTFALLLTAACALATPSPPPPTPPTQTPTSSPTPAPTPTRLPLPTPTPTPVSVRLVLWENLPPAQSSTLNADAGAFEAAYPNYTLDIQHYDEAQALLDAIVDERVEFHLALGNAFLASALQARDTLEPIDEGLPRELLESFAQPTLAGATRDGHLWGLPDTAGLHLLLFYNRDLVARPPANTEELHSLAESFTSDGQWGLALNSYDPLWVVPWMWAYGGWLTNSDGKPELNTPPMT